MKGFPNQVAELTKIADAVAALVELVDSGADAKDDGVFGQTLVHARVAGTGHVAQPIKQYIAEQLRKTPSNQSFRTTARGLRELFRLLGLIDDSGAQVHVTEAGRQAAAFAGSPLNAEQIAFWRRVIRDITHDGGGQTSHPYQVLLRLVARKPGITRAKCALALEARDDSTAELSRIVTLADLEEDEIRRRIGVTESNWDNAKKVLPKFAEQLGDVVRRGQSFTLADSPGRAEEAPAGLTSRSVTRTSRRGGAVRAPRASRSVTPGTIGSAGTAEEFDEGTIPVHMDAASLRAAIRQRLDRLRRHNLIVKALAAHLSEAGAQLYEDPFDILAAFDEFGILAEIKSLDGTVADERDRVREALAQLLYYEAFVTDAVVGEAAIHKIACFEARITEPHQKWLNDAGIGSMWRLPDGGFRGDRLAVSILGDYIEDLG